MNSIDERFKRLHAQVPRDLPDVETFARELHRQRCERAGADMRHVDLYWEVVDQNAYILEATRKLSRMRGR